MATLTSACRPDIGDIVEVALGVGLLVIYGRRDLPSVHGQQGEDGFDPPGGPETVPRHALCGAHHDLAAVVAKDRFDGHGFVKVVKRRGGSVGIDVINVLSV